MNTSSLLMGGLAATFLALPALTPAFADEKGVVVFDWSGFDVEGLYKTYKDKYGAEPNYSFYGDDDEAYQKLASGFKADVAHPCSQMVSKYRDSGLIEPWDVSRIDAFKDIDPKFLNSPIFKDEGGVWYLPTDWGVTAIAYNPDEVPAEDVSTLQVFVNPKYKGRISLPNSSDDVWALAYLATGVTDWTKVTDAQFDKAAAWLREANKNVQSYWADPSEMAQVMASGEVQVAWSWNDGVNYLRQDNYPVKFQREAKEGSSTWFCGYVHLKDHPGDDQKAYDFMNSWLRPEAAQALVDAIGYGHSNVKGMELVSKDQKDEAGLGPINAPILAQVPNDPTLREKQLAEFEKIKAGY